MSSNSAETTIEGSFESEGTGVNISQRSPIPGPTSSTASVARRRPVRCDQWLSTFVTNAVDAYCKELKESPIRTKAITSCAISMLGELIGTALKPRKPDGSRGSFSQK